MKASFVDLRRKSAQILRALDRGEQVTVHYRGRPKAVMQPVGKGPARPVRTKDHPAFGLWADRKDMADVAAYMRALRRGRFDDL